MPRNFKINEKLAPFIEKHKPLKVIIGGRASGKSLGVADIMSGIFMDTYGENVLCLREFMQSITESVHNVMKESVEDRLGLDGWTVERNRLISPNGAYTHYLGASRNPQAVRSMQGFRKSWFEEAQTASEASLDALIPTILRNVGAECWFTANPMSSGDPFSQKFIVPFQKELDQHGYYEDDMHMIMVLNWRDNPWWNEASDAVRKHDLSTMTRAKYDHIWEGAFNDEVEDSIIMAEWFDAAVDLHKRHPEAFKPHGAIVAAHDPFDDGGDAGGFAVRHGSIIKEVRTKQSGLIDEVCDWAIGLSIQAGADWFVWDGDGMGTGLRRQVSDGFNGKRTDFHMFRGSLSGSGQDNANRLYMDTDDPDRAKKYSETFKNNRAQYYTRLAKRFYNSYLFAEKGKYIDPDEMISLNKDGIDDIVGLRSQLCRIPSKPNSQGLIQIMGKQDMKKLGITSPNEADAIMMTMYEPSPDVGGFDIQFKGW